MKRIDRAERNKVIRGASVEVRNNDVNSALRKLKKILETDNRQKDLAKHEFYEKPSVKTRRAKNQARKRTQKDEFTNVLAGVANKPATLRYMKSKRKRRKIIDQDYYLKVAMRNKQTDM